MNPDFLLRSKTVYKSLLLYMFGFAAITLCFIRVPTSLGQDWIVGRDGSQYNCDLIQELISNFGDEHFVKHARSELMTIAEHFAETVPNCNQVDETSLTATVANFRVTVKSAVNLRECAGTSCKLVGKAQSGDILEVIGEDGDWYEVKFENSSAYIAGWLTTPLPDAFIESDEPYYVPSGCVVVPDSSRSSDMDVNIIITGDRKDDVVVDLYRPNDETALRVDGQLDKTFIDTGDTYILQYYYWNTWWPTGVYIIELGLDGESNKIAWHLKERAEYNVFVSCD